MGFEIRFFKSNYFMNRYYRSLEIAARIINILVLVGGLLILVSMSYDIIHVKQYHLSPGFLKFQFVVCLIFMADFFLRLSLARNKWKFFANNFIYLLVSIPWLNILQWTRVDLSRPLFVIAKSAPLLRGFYAILIVTRWLTRSGLHNLMYSYVFTVVGFTYFAALLFFSFEEGVNPQVSNFGDCLWWAWMNVTTVGANIFAVTGVGKVLSVILPSLGMMMFPIFTVYVIDHFKRLHSASQRNIRHNNSGRPAQTKTGTSPQAS